MDTIDMKMVWKHEQEILDLFHKICIENKFRYSLGYGTLLGAIRHNGFIPWDDDIDIIMPRRDYDCFISFWNNNPIDGYILQDEYNSRDDYPNNFCKLRKDHTTFIQDKKEMIKKYHKGIFIDIFPMDRVAPKGIQRKLQFIAFSVYMLLSRDYCDNSKNTAYLLIQKVLLAFPKSIKRIIKQLTFHFMTKWNKNNSYQLVVPCTFAFSKMYYPNDLFNRIIKKEFNKKKYLITENYDGFLKAMYGNYMQLPPECDRTWKHTPIIVDYKHNFEELRVSIEE
ncbi:LicD family protein [Ruminococcus albus]|jgi:lipopolysaccharide cholinephosphotransferase|uniref:LicD family protein n=1 Tax=Ruminococcus albus TaxID=1264 RepID=UPI0004642A15|nr:LicD family protein [Ruminococcus albus]